MRTNTFELRLYWGDTDPAGIAFYPHYFRWFDMATDELFRAMGAPWAELFPAHKAAGCPIVEAGCRFTAPIFYHDVIRLVSRVTEVRQKSFRVEHEVYQGGDLKARGFEVRVWAEQVDGAPRRLRARPIPEEVVALLRSEEQGHAEA